MRAVIQRVAQASCSVEGQVIGHIKKGLLVLIGIESDDSLEDAKWLANKIISMRIFGDDKGLMNKSLLEVDGELLFISQFTLMARTKKGNRPSFIQAAKPEYALSIYDSMCEYLSDLLPKPVQRGEFGADMQVELLNDGPVTIIMDTKDKDKF